MKTLITLRKADQVLLGLISVFFQIFHKGRSTRADIRVITGGVPALFVDIARRIFKMTASEVRNSLNISVVSLRKFTIRRIDNKSAQPALAAQIIDKFTMPPTGDKYEAHQDRSSSGLRLLGTKYANIDRIFLRLCGLLFVQSTNDRIRQA